MAGPAGAAGPARARSPWQVGLVGLLGLLAGLAVLGGALVCTGSAHAAPVHAGPAQAAEASADAPAYNLPSSATAEDEPGCRAPRAADVRPSAVPLRTASGSQLTAPVLAERAASGSRAASDRAAAAPPAHGSGPPATPTPVQLSVLRV